MQVIPKRNFLVRQEILAGGKKKDIHARKGEKIELSEPEVIKFWGGVDIDRLDEKVKKNLLNLAKRDGIRRRI